MHVGAAGLRQTWEKHLERERLRELRFNLLGGQGIWTIPSLQL